MATGAAAGPEGRRATTAAFWQAMATLTSMGWAMALPIAAGVLLGRLLDSRTGSGATWTLVLLLGGIGVAAVAAFVTIRTALRRFRRG